MFVFESSFKVTAPRVNTSVPTRLSITAIQSKKLGPDCPRPLMTAGWLVAKNIARDLSIGFAGSIDEPEIILIAFKAFFLYGYGHTNHKSPRSRNTFNGVLLIDWNALSRLASHFLAACRKHHPHIQKSRSDWNHLLVRRPPF